MANSECRVCGAELLPGTAFCRQCGSPAAEAIPASEQQTALFSQAAESSTTQRLDPRPTSPDRGRLQSSATSIANGSSGSGRAGQKSLLILAIIGALAGVLTVVAIVRIRNHTAAAESAARSISTSSRVLIYPGSQSIVDMINNDGSRTIQLRTTDPLDRVENWYQSNLKLTKTVRLTSSSVVMKNEKVTITLANEDNKTVILVKQLP